MAKKFKNTIILLILLSPLLGLEVTKVMYDLFLVTNGAMDVLSQFDGSVFFYGLITGIGILGCTLILLRVYGLIRKSDNGDD